MVNVGIFYAHMAIPYILQPFGLVCGRLIHFSQFGMFGPRKIWQPNPGMLRIKLTLVRRRLAGGNFKLWQLKNGENPT
jgi:hypothetical protein